MITMHPTTVLILVCVCAVYAGKHNLKPPVKHHFFYPPSPDIQKLKWSSNTVALWDTQTMFSVEEESPQYHESDELQQALPKVWEAPPYRQALEDFDEAVTEIKRHFPLPLEALTDKDVKTIRYIVIVQAVDSLSKAVAEEGWDYYERNYAYLVQEVMESTVSDPQSAVRQIECTIFAPASKNLQRVRTIIQNPTVKSICRLQPTACDAVIFAALKLKNDNELENEFNLLLSVGQAASTFLKLYANAFDDISTENSYLYLKLLKSKDRLKELVGKNANARRVLECHSCHL